MAPSEQTSNSAGRWTVARQVGQFTFVGIVAVTIVGLATAVASRRAGEREAIVDARTTTFAKAQGFVEPVVTNGLFTADPASVAKVSAVVKRDVLDDSLVRVKIWNRNGTVVYSDEPRLIGSRYTLGPDEVAALDTGVIEADVSDLTNPRIVSNARTESCSRCTCRSARRTGNDSCSRATSVTPRSPHPVHASGAASRRSRSARCSRWSSCRSRSRIRSRAAPPTPARTRGSAPTGIGRVGHGTPSYRERSPRRGRAGSRGRRVRAGRRGRRDDIKPESAEVLDQAAGDVRVSIKSLRSLLVEIYPPNLFEEGLVAARPTSSRWANGKGIATSLDTEELTNELPPAAPASCTEPRRKRCATCCRTRTQRR